jgi:hypothetical protein
MNLNIVEVLICYANYVYISPSFIDTLRALLIISMMNRKLCYWVSLFIYDS